MKRRNFLIVCTAVLFAFCFTFTASGANEVAEVSIGSSGIYWQPKVSYTQISLTVSCPDGQVFQKNFEGGTSPYLDISDIKGQLRDGSYTYELRVTPFIKKKTREGGAMAQKSGGDIPGLRNLTQTGYFTVHGGAIVIPGAVAEQGGKPAVTQGDPARPLDQVILDDLIVDGSICVGFDCINGESFGFDTLRLKENNLRIRFYDTSTSASFPTNDWQITANDSTNGGANKFSIDDIDGGRIPFTIEAGAPSNSLYVEDGGRVGFGTSTPAVELHIKDSDTPTLRLEQDSSGGWTAQTWDVAGNEANFFIRDATNGSTLPFRIKPGASSDSIYIASSGNVGFGTSSPAFKVHAQTTGANCAFVAERASGAQNYMNATDSFANFGSVTDHPLRLVSNNVVRMLLDTDGDVAVGGGPNTIDPPHKLTVYNDANTAYGYSEGGAWATGSSREFKENIKDIDAAEAMAAFQTLNPVRFNYKGVQDDEHLGFIAEDVPEIVAMKNRDAISAMDMVTLLTKVVQEQQKVMQQNKKTVEQHEKTIAELKKEISKLKKNR